MQVSGSTLFAYSIMKGNGNMKKIITFLPLVLALALSACGGGHRDSESQETLSSYSEISSSTQSVTKYTVRFLVENEVVQTSLVEEGGLAIFESATPTKAGDAENYRYRFKEWDRDITLPIFEDTDFHATFVGYDQEIMIGDFEDYEDSASMIDDGWVALGYSSSTQTWTEDTGATVSLGFKSIEGSKSLKFGAWENGVGYKFAKRFGRGGLSSKSANALRFRLMVPEINVVKVLLHASATIQGQAVAPYFIYTLQPQSGEFVEYVIPLADDGWALWGNAESIKDIVEWTGIHQDDILQYLTRIEFFVQGNDGLGGRPYIAFLDSASFVTLDDPRCSEVETMGDYDRYTGLLADGETIVRVDLGDNGAATAKLLNLETPVEVSGTYSVENKILTFTSSDNGQTLVYSGKLLNGGQSIRFESASGSLRQQLGELDLKAVQVVDNYDQYEIDGLAYYQGNPDKNNRSGARGAYYSEYYSGNGNADFGGSGWSLLGGDGSQLMLMQDGGHSGNNYLKLKNASGVALRYMQWGLIDGTSEQNSFRGNKMGFWAKTSGKVPAFKVYMYSQTMPRNATKDEKVKSFNFNEPEPVDEWKHYELDLDPGAVYYGFAILLDHNDIENSYLFIDDVEVYGENPYAEYHEPEPEPPFDFKAGLVFNAPIVDGMVNLNICIKEGGNANLSAPSIGINVDGTYVMDDHAATFTFGDTEYVAEVADDYSNISFVSVSGDDSIAEILNQLNFTLSNYADSFEGYAESGTMYSQKNGEVSRSGARGAYYCDYYTGSGSSPVGGNGWNLMGGNSDQLSLEQTIPAVEGTQCLKIKKSTAGAMRYMQWDLYKGTGTAKTGFDKFVIYLKNPGETDATVNVMVYDVRKVTPTTQGAANREETGEVSLPAGTDWTPYVVELDPLTEYYGFCILLKSSTTDYVYADAAHYVRGYDDSTLYANHKLDMTLFNDDVSFQFIENGEGFLSCASLGMENMNCNFRMALKDANTQEMTISFNESYIKGIYAVDINGRATFTVTETTADLADYFPVDTVLSNK